VRIAWLASFVHKWLALIIGIHIFIWIATGLFFTIVPIEQVRSALAGPGSKIALTASSR
jgi:hypothetical protein